MPTTLQQIAAHLLEAESAAEKSLNFKRQEVDE
jgi:hypothetical protein